MTMPNRYINAECCTFYAEQCHAYSANAPLNDNATTPSIQGALNGHHFASNQEGLDCVPYRSALRHGHMQILAASPPRQMLDAILQDLFGVTAPLCAC